MSQQDQSSGQQSREHAGCMRSPVLLQQSRRHAATARITHTRNACPVSSYVAGKRLEQTLAGHPRIAPSPFAPVGPPHLPLTAVVWCLYRRPAAWATGQPHAKRKVGGAAGSATGALLAPTAPRRVAWLGYVPRAQLWRGGGGIGVCGSSRVRLRRLSRLPPV